MNNQNSNIIIGAVIAVILCSGIAFYAGQHLGNHAAGNSAYGSAAGNRSFGQGGTAERGAPQRFGGATIGSVLSKDQNSLTVKLQNGGSQIVFYSASTSIVKSSPSSIDAVGVGDSVLITGKPNSDGSLSASSIQDGMDMNRFRGAASGTPAASTAR